MGNQIPTLNLMGMGMRKNLLNYLIWMGMRRYSPAKGTPFAIPIFYLVASFPTIPSSLKTEFICIFYFVFELEVTGSLCREVLHLSGKISFDGS
jgi:hypothetical protein